MDCLSSNQIMLFHQKALKKFGGSEGILHLEGIVNLQPYVTQIAALNFNFDDLETACLATYQIVKGHFFIDGNKRTAQYVLLNCLKVLGYSYTGRQIDLARKIEELAQSSFQQKEESVMNLAYFLKSRLQKIEVAKNPVS